MNNGKGDCGCAQQESSTGNSPSDVTHLLDAPKVVGASSNVELRQLDSVAIQNIALLKQNSTTDEPSRHDFVDTFNLAARSPGLKSEYSVKTDSPRSANNSTSLLGVVQVGIGNVFGCVPTQFQSLSHQIVNPIGRVLGSLSMGAGFLDRLRDIIGVRGVKQLHRPTQPITNPGAEDPTVHDTVLIEKVLDPDVDPNRAHAPLEGWAYRCRQKLRLKGHCLRWVRIKRYVPFCLRTRAAFPPSPPGQGEWATMEWALVEIELRKQNPELQSLFDMSENEWKQVLTDIGVTGDEIRSMASGAYKALNNNYPCPSDCPVREDILTDLAYAIKDIVIGPGNPRYSKSGECYVNEPYTYYDSDGRRQIGQFPRKVGYFYDYHLDIFAQVDVAFTALVKCRQ